MEKEQNWLKVVLQYITDIVQSKQIIFLFVQYAVDKVV